MAFIPYSNNEASRMTLLVDRYARVQLNTALQKRLKNHDEDLEVVLFFEPETRRIGISTDYPKSHDTWLKVDERGYVGRSKSFLVDNDIEFAGESTKYFYDGTVNGVLTFRASVEGKRIRTSLRQEKNGNLERSR